MLNDNFSVYTHHCYCSSDINTGKIIRDSCQIKGLAKEAQEKPLEIDRFIG